MNDFGTFDGTSPPGGATGAATALAWTDIVTAPAGNYTVTAYLSNEVSRTQTTATVSKAGVSDALAQKARGVTRVGLRLTETSQ